MLLAVSSERALEKIGLATWQAVSTAAISPLFSALMSNSPS